LSEANGLARGIYAGQQFRAAIAGKFSPKVPQNEQKQSKSQNENRHDSVLANGFG
jgi:hypothetical protein